ncbi:MAG: type IV pilus modification protein PilV [Pseudomonadota bacterium]
MTRQPTRPSLSTRRRIRGFSLIETLVAMVVLATGMLGIAALYVESLRAGRSAHSRTLAINLAADMADRIRANRAGRQFYNVAAGNAGAQPTACGELNGVPAQNCTPQQMAAFDIWLWKSMVGETTQNNYRRMGLPGATAEIQINTATQPNSFIIRISWTERNETFDYELSTVI